MSVKDDIVHRVIARGIFKGYTGAQSELFGYPLASYAALTPLSGANLHNLYSSVRWAYNK